MTQAFHWFSNIETLTQIFRILKLQLKTQCGTSEESQD
jgi:hypothetical protein